jgi:MFS family permease
MTRRQRKVTETTAARISPLAVFGRRDFVLMWLAQLVSTAGSALTDLAAGIYVYQQTGSAFLVGVTLMVTAVPSMIVGLVAGVFVDRWNRRRVMLASNLAEGLVVAAIPFVIGQPVLWLYLLLLANAAVKQFFDPAYEALIPEIASDEELNAANAFLQIASFGSTAIGFAGAGLLAAIDIRIAFWIDALTFVVSAGCIALMRTSGSVEAPEETVTVRTVVANLRSGARAIRETPMLRSLFLLGAPVFFAFGLWNVLLLPMAIKVLGASEFEYGIQEGLTSIGFVVGSLFMARFGERLQPGLWVFIGTMGMAVSGVAYGLAPTIAIAIAFASVSGFFNSPSAVARSTLLQRHTPRELRGRVFSALFVMRDVVFLAGMAGAGIADLVDVRLLVVLASGILALVAVWALFAPGIGRPAAEWRRGLAALRAPSAGGPGGSRPAAVADFELLAGRMATFSRLSITQRDGFLAGAVVRDAAEGTRIVSHGEPSTAAFFILDGEAAAGIPDAEGGYRGLSVMGVGDVFGEIAALTGSPRTADVVATRHTTLLEVPADSLRAAMEEPEVDALLRSRLAERLARSSRPDLPRLASFDQAALRDLRTRAPEGD